MTDYLALIGDPIDNVPKVPGIGPKTATELIAQFGNVETLLGRLEEVKKPKIREALEQHRDAAPPGQAAGHLPDRPAAGDRRRPAGPPAHRWGARPGALHRAGVLQAPARNAAQSRTRPPSGPLARTEVVTDRGRAGVAGGAASGRGPGGAGARLRRPPGDRHPHRAGPRRRGRLGLRLARPPRSRGAERRARRTSGNCSARSWPTAPSTVGPTTPRRPPWCWPARALPSARWVRTSSSSPTCSTPPGGSTPSPTWPGSASTSSSRCPTTRPPRAGRGAGSADRPPEEVAEAFGRERRRWTGWPPGCGGTWNPPG